MPSKAPTKKTTTPQKETPQKAAPKYDDGPLRAQLADALETVAGQLAGVKEAVRRLASGAVVTEEQRDELCALLEGK